MPRDIPLSNGRLLICFDKDYQIRDVYFPHVGQENHCSGYTFRFGVWVNGSFSWVSDPQWHKKLEYLEDTLVTKVTITNEKLGLEIECNDFVDCHYDLYNRSLRVKNLTSAEKEVRIFFHQDFRIYGSDVGDTAIYEPYIKSVIHYKGSRYFLCGLSDGVEHYSIGKKGQIGSEGTWRDAEDGELGNNPITQGAVDSTIGKYFKLPAKKFFEFDYWICAGKTFSEVADLTAQVIAEGGKVRRKMTEEYWRLWVNKESIDYSPLPSWAASMFKRSLLVIRTQIDNDGAILAANDSDIQFSYKDHYSYLWPRDGALVAAALDEARYESITQKFYAMVGKLITSEGYLHHKYNPDGSLASSWHPLIRNGKPQLPIQEDETALIIWSLWQHFRVHRDVEFVRGLYRKLICKAADFLLSYRDPKTKLPLPSYDLWEERRGVMTFTTCTVEAGLRAAGHFSKAFGDVKYLDYYEAADEMKAAIEKYLFDKKSGCYLRGLVLQDENSCELTPDKVMDASVFALFKFGTFKANDPKVKSTMQAYRELLWVKTPVGGIARYQNDYYQSQVHPSDKVPGNPWIICTLWLMMYEIMLAENEAQLMDSLYCLEWVKDSAALSGVLSEQVNPINGKHVSVSPLTWSHATVVDVVMMYLKKVSELRKQKHLNYSIFNND